MSAKPKQSSVAAPEGKPQHVDLDSLEFDPENPRTLELLGRDASQGRIEEFLLGGEMKARDLVPSFIANGYIPYEPLIVRPRKAKNQFVVVEGNRRLAALRSMRDSDDPEERSAFADHQLSRVPCLVFEGDERQLLAYLGLRHLSKTKDWTTAAKGAFVERVLRASKERDPGAKLREAGRLTNTSTSALRLTLLTRRLFERADALGLSLPNTGADRETTFWHLGDAVRRSNTKSYLRLEENPDPLLAPTYDEDRFEKLITWLYGNPKSKQSPLISSIRDIPDLNSCLGDPRSIRALENGESLQEALEELEAAGATVAAHLERAKKSVQRAGTGLSDVDQDGLNQVQPAYKQVSEALEQFAGSLAVRIKKLSEKL
ncbi:MAG: ParB N-terminal domain-containing protein [Verrucomicrobia bacterium]|nr:ParB N-terminal domain-containing protein [Verrucomicrobiota bacterium]